MAVTPGLPSNLLSFLWQTTHNLLPCPTRLYRLQMPNIRSDLCTLCDQKQIGNLSHCLLQCPYNDGAGQFLLSKLSKHIPNLLQHQVVLLDLNVGDCQLPLVFLCALILQQVLMCRKEKKPVHLLIIRATLEASIIILRKSRFKSAEEFLIVVLGVLTCIHYKIKI